MRGRKKKSLEYSQKQRSRKQLQRLMEELGEAVVLVEGKKDAEAMHRYVRGVMEVSGRTRSACRRVADSGEKEVVVLTDLDQRGNELAKELEAELRSNGVKANLAARKKVGKILCLHQMENFERKYREKLEETKL